MNMIQISNATQTKFNNRSFSKDDVVVMATMLKCSIWALTREWMLARDTTVMLVVRYQLMHLKSTKSHPLVVW